MNIDENQTIADKVKSVDSDRRQRSMTFAFFLSIAVISSIVLIFSDDISHAFAARYDESSDIALRTFIIRIFATSALIGFIAYVTYLYLEGGLSTLKRSEEGTLISTSSSSFSLIAESLEESAKAISSNQTISDADTKTITDTLGAAIEQSLSANFLENIERKYGRTIQHGLAAAGFDDLFQRTKNRLGDFKGELSRKANINLVAGLIIGALGLVVLIVFISNSQSLVDYENVDRYFYYISRLALVAIIESVAFFFLRQYRQALSDEKFVANEITNVELKLLALKTATQLKMDTAIELSVGDLAMTDRNTISVSSRKNQPVSGDGQKQVDDLIKTLQNLKNLK